MVKSYKTNLLNWLKTKFYTEDEVDTKLGTKSDVNHNHDSAYSKLGHNHDERYYTESEVDTKLKTKSDTGHNHNDTYYTEAEVDTKLKTKSDSGHTHDERYYTESEVDTKLNSKAGLSTATSSANGLMSSGDKSKLDGVAAGATKVTVDTALSSTSTNPVQNKIINSALSGKASSSHTHDERYYTESEVDTKVTSLNNALTTLSKAYLKNSLVIKIGRASDGGGENGTKIEVNSGVTGIYAQLYCDDSSFSLAGRTVAFLINGMTYERDTDSKGKTGTVNINLGTGNYLITVFTMGTDSMNPSVASKRLIVS